MSEGSAAGERDQTRELLTASQAFTDTVTVDDVRQRVAELVTTELRPSYVGLSLLDADRRLQRANAALEELRQLVARGGNAS